MPTTLNVEHTIRFVTILREEIYKDNIQPSSTHYNLQTGIKMGKHVRKAKELLAEEIGLDATYIFSTVVDFYDEMFHVTITLNEFMPANQKEEFGVEIKIENGGEENDQDTNK